MTPFLVGVTLVGVCYIAYVVEDFYEKSKLMMLRIDSAEKRVDFCRKRIEGFVEIHEGFRRRLDELEKANTPLRLPSQKDEEKDEGQSITVETNDPKSASDKVRSKIENIDLMNAFAGHEYETLEKISELASSRNISIVVVKENGKDVCSSFCMNNKSLAVSVITCDGKRCVDEFIGIIGCGN